jgi:hypothetical protein
MSWILNNAERIPEINEIKNCIQLGTALGQTLAQLNGLLKILINYKCYRDT